MVLNIDLASLKCVKEGNNHSTEKLDQVYVKVQTVTVDLETTEFILLFIF